MRRRRGELLVIGREQGAEESGLLLNLESWRMENTHPVLSQRDLTIGGEGGGAMREGRRARKQVKCWKMGRWWRHQDERGGDGTGHLRIIRVPKTRVPQVCSHPPSWVPLQAILLHLH